jgi:hypothetical protein
MASLLADDNRWPQTQEEQDRFIRDLLDTDWDTDNGAIRLRSDLTLEQVAQATFFDHSRQFLRLLADERGAPLTATGNLNRACVAHMIERLPWLKQASEDSVRLVTSMKFNEEDLLPLHYVRVVCECGKLTIRRRGRMLATKKAAVLCDDAQAGALFRRLFDAFFRRFSLDYLSYFPETPFIQHSIAVILMRLSFVARDWIAAANLPREVLIRPVSQQIRVTFPKIAHAESWMLVIKVLEPLCWFGLLEMNTSDQKNADYFSDTKFRKTPLFDQFLSFEFKP